MVAVDQTIINNIMSGPMKTFLSTYKVGLSIFIGFAFVTCIIVLIMNIVKFGKAQEHPLVRKQAIHGLLVSGLCLGLLLIFGSIYVFMLSLL